MKIYTDKPTNTLFLRDENDGRFGSVAAFDYARNGDAFTITNNGEMRVETKDMPYTVFRREDGSSFISADEFESYLIDALTVVENVSYEEYLRDKEAMTAQTQSVRDQSNWSTTEW